MRTITEVLGQNLPFPIRRKTGGDAPTETTNEVLIDFGPGFIVTEKNGKIFRTENGIRTDVTPKSYPKTEDGYDIVEVGAGFQVIEKQSTGSDKGKYHRYLRVEGAGRDLYVEKVRRYPQSTGSASCMARAYRVAPASYGADDDGD